jgi:hypothetical protein
MLSFFTRSRASVILLIVFSSFLYIASNNGYTGATKSGCTCHTKNTAVSVVIAGPATLAPGAKGVYTMTITGGPLKGAGVDIAASSGTLAVDASESFLKLSGKELTHKSPKSVSNNAVVFTFDYTAPSTTGTATISGVGNSVNLNNSESGDGWNFATPFTVTVSTTAGVNEQLVKNHGYALNQNYPNPFNPSTSISYTLAQAGNVSLRVFDVTGKEVTRLVDGVQPAGEHKVQFDASRMQSGVYFYTIETSTFKETRKMLLLK